MEKLFKFLNIVLSVALVVLLSMLLFSGSKSLSLGALGEPNPTTLDRGEWTALNDLVVDDMEVTDDLTVKGDTTLAALTTSGALTVSGDTILEDVTFKVSQTAVAQTGATSTVTLTNADSGTTYLLSATGTSIVLPTVTTSAGVFYRFQVAGDLGVANMVISVASTTIEDIEGTLLVAGAVVDCADETAINFVVDGENIGDYFEIMSDGTNWLLGDSAVLTASKLTCTGG